MNNDLTLINEAVDVYRPYPVSTKNVGQVLAAFTFKDSWDLSDLVNRIVLVYGGSRLNALCKVAQSLLSCKVTINDHGKVEMYHG